MPKLIMVEAINLALKQEMRKDPTVVTFGEDVGRNGGVFRVTDGIQKEFGVERCFDTPLGESGIVGMAIGMAINGLKPVAEIQFDGFFYQGFDQIVNHAARMRNRSRGRFTVPMVLRFPVSGGVHALEHHSESTEAIPAHIPGIKVVMPSTPYDAKGLLISAIRDPDPVIFMEPKRVYRAIREEVPEEEYTIPIGKAKIVQDGKDVTVVTWGAMVRESQKALTELAAKNISVELIDLRTISPMDQETILNSVRKTGRLVIVQEAPRSFGVGAEIAAFISEKALLNLKAPIERVTAPDVTVTLFKREDLYLPDLFRIIKGVEKVMTF